MFSHIGGLPRNRMARLEAATAVADDVFNPNANNDVFSIAVQSDGKVLAGGQFATIGGQPRDGEDYYEHKHRQRLLTRLHKQAALFGFQLTPQHSSLGSVS